MTTDKAYFHEGDIIKVTSLYGVNPGELVAIGKVDRTLSFPGFAGFTVTKMDGLDVDLNINSVHVEVLWSDWQPPFEWPTSRGSIVEGRRTLPGGTKEIELFQVDNDGYWVWAGMEGTWVPAGLENECEDYTFTLIRDGLGDE